MRKIFFYGLFMDHSLLTGQGLRPVLIGKAVLPGYRIHIGARATLVPSTGGRAYGVLMELTDQEANALYAEPSVRAYAPERVVVELLESGEAIQAQCYNLPRDMALAGTNPDYALRLAQLAEALLLDPAYIREIAAFADI